MTEEKVTDEDTLFFKLVKNISTKSDISVKNKSNNKYAYKKFLLANHFLLEDGSQSIPHRRMRERGILANPLLDEKNHVDCIQIGSEVFEFDLSQIPSQDGR